MADRTQDPEAGGGPGVDLINLHFGRKVFGFITRVADNVLI
jgi:hypothetical protein